MQEIEILIEVSYATVIHLFNLSWFNTKSCYISQLVILNYAGEHLKLSYLSPYLDSLAPNFTSGVNFAVSGATLLPQFVPFALDVQVRQFIRFKNRSLELLSMGTLVSFETSHNNPFSIANSSEILYPINFLIWCKKNHAGSRNSFGEDGFRSARTLYDWPWREWSLASLVCIKLIICTSYRKDPFISCRNQTSPSSEYDPIC